jgi:hypothetical protein
VRWIGGKLLTVVIFISGLCFALFIQDTVFPRKETKAVLADSAYQRMLDEQAKEDQRVLDNFVEANTDETHTPY